MMPLGEHLCVGGDRERFN